MNNGHAKPGLVEPVAEPGDKAPPPAEIVAAAFSGPIPPPAMFAQYEDVLPGSADRILTQAEKEQDHRHQQEASLLRARIDDLGMARFYSFLTTCGVLGLVAWLAYLQQVWLAWGVGGSSIIATIIGLVRSFRVDHVPDPDEEAADNKPSA